MSDFQKHLPDPETILALEAEEIAGYLLDFFHSISEKDRQRNVMRPDWLGSSQPIDDYPPQYREPISMALMEAWSWLEREGLLAPLPQCFGGGSYFITRRGRRLKRRADVEDFRRRSGLPRHILHAVISEKAWPAFVRGEYDTAVFQAFKEVEVAVRTAAEFAMTDLGTDLMRKAFNQTTGLLSDASEPLPEREALAHLFAGAIGRFKNPSSHRHVAITDPGETFEMLAFASHLLRIVDDRKKPRNPSTDTHLAG
jgi:uncharacterized protein (TIGR02391 family)